MGMVSVFSASAVVVEWGIEVLCYNQVNTTSEDADATPVVAHVESDPCRSITCSPQAPHGA